MAVFNTHFTDKEMETWQARAPWPRHTGGTREVELRSVWALSRGI